MILTTSEPAGSQFVNRNCSWTEMPLGWTATKTSIIAIIITDHHAQILMIITILILMIITILILMIIVILILMIIVILISANVDFCRPVG